ncbi:hypothetical protein PHLGIDRAFT_96990 [Phlebiopsis gigantea 11061_1 CR5-6]|uniref:Ubiquitin-like domain-containing protein n=1 Tax=Phlebiopsis gigantea (strain 11061_1 CR5-6) TaxID=745531 RepID=A0A0C3S1Q6_PHLG1|nr:hypothetical protein PHLGIDRAFT_96990 [Phlebiopsis gigantea 11061_1 CR5-6]
MSDGNEEKPDVKPKLTVQVQFDGQTCTVKVKPTTLFKKIFEAAETRFGQPAGAFRYNYDGERIRPEQTPAELGMEEGDIVDAHLQQTGGSWT